MGALFVLRILKMNKIESKIAPFIKGHMLVTQYENG